MHRAVLSTVLAILVSVTTAQRPLGDIRNDEIEYQQSSLRSIFGNYNSDRRPPSKDGSSFSSVIVTVSAHILGVKFAHGAAYVKMYFRQRWVDSRLTLAQSEDGETVPQLRRGLLVPQTRRVWTPNTYFVQGDVKHRDDRFTQTIIEGGGEIFHSQLLTVKMPADQNLASGTIKVNFQLGSCKKTRRKVLQETLTDSYDSSDVFYRWQRANAIFGPVVTNSDEQANCTDSFEDIGAYSCVRATVYLRDNCWSVLVRYGFASVALIIVSMLHFWLPSAWTVARPLSAVLPTVIFAATMLAGLVNLDSWTELIWFTICLGVTLSSTLEYYLVATWHAVGKHGGKRANEETTPLNEISGVGNHAAAPLDILCRLVLPLVFIGLIAAFIVLFGFIIWA